MPVNSGRRNAIMEKAMKTAKSLLWPCAVLLFIVLPARAQEIGQSAPAPELKYRMELAYIYDTDSPEYVFVINGVIGCKSVASLKKYLSLLPPGSILQWAPGCRRRGDEPLLSSEQEMEDFKAFCAEKNINFILVPSG
jgi:hypothetical protein